MHEVELTSELYMLILSGIDGKSQKKINSVYDKYDKRFNERSIVEQRFEKVMDEIESNIGSKIVDTIYSQKTVFYILFSILYDKLFRIKSKLRKTSAKKIPQKTYLDLIDLGIYLEKKGLENIMASGTRRLSTLDDRQDLFKYIKKKI